MFSLIITLISIALVAALALATLYYGGQAFTDGSTRAEVAKVLQERTQVSGALTLYKANHGGYPSGTSEEIAAELISKEYLKQIPAGAWEFRNDFTVRTNMAAEVCLSVNQKAGVNEVPSCSSPAYAGQTICCSVP